MNTRLLLCYFIILLSLLAYGSDPARAESKTETALTLEDYLALLERISPSARVGSQAYITAYQRHCHRALTLTELRRAISDGNGDPVLMGMIQASYLKDTAALNRWENQLHCLDRIQP